MIHPILLDFINGKINCSEMRTMGERTEDQKYGCQKVINSILFILFYCFTLEITDLAWVKIRREPCRANNDSIYLCTVQTSSLL